MQNTSLKLVSESYPASKPSMVSPIVSEEVVSVVSCTAMVRACFYLAIANVVSSRRIRRRIEEKHDIEEQPREHTMIQISQPSVGSSIGRMYVDFRRGKGMWERFELFTGAIGRRTH